MFLSATARSIPPCTDPQPGDILEFNGSIFSAMVRQWGAEAKVYPIVPHQFDQIKAMVATTAEECDMVLPCHCNEKPETRQFLDFYSIA